MRVIAGEFKGRKLVTFKGHQLRPLTDRIKASVFDQLQTNLYNSTVLDLFSGSGSFGIEALSRGADSVVFIEKYRPATFLIKKNLDSLSCNSDKYSIICKDAVEYLKTIDTKKKFDIIFSDPPYKYKFFNNFFSAAASGQYLSEKGIFIIRHPENVTIVEESNLKMHKDKKFGESFVKFFINSGE
ncbi:16S rRNA (guanine(966)-N(2))-methyltransferase RsmD [candidate division KSB1 bacterium]